jgi:hypothetical protein
VSTCLPDGTTRLLGAWHSCVVNARDSGESAAGPSRLPDAYAAVLCALVRAYADRVEGTPELSPRSWRALVQDLGQLGRDRGWAPASGALQADGSAAESRSESRSGDAELAAACLGLLGSAVLFAARGVVLPPGARLPPLPGEPPISLWISPAAARQAFARTAERPGLAAVYPVEFDPDTLNVTGTGLSVPWARVRTLTAPPASRLPGPITKRR